MNHFNAKFSEMVRGASAYEVAVRNGFEGTEQEWLESIADAKSAQIAAEEAQRKAEAAQKASEKAETAAKQAAQTAAENASASEAFAQQAAGFADFDWFPRFWHEQYDGVVLKHTTLWPSNSTSINFTDDAKGAQHLNVGDKVIVHFAPNVGEAIDLECVVKEHIWEKETAGFDGKTIYIGNFGARYEYGNTNRYPANLTTPDTGEPFFIELERYWQAGERCLVFTWFDDNVTYFELSIDAVEDKNHLPDKFLSGTVVKNGDTEMTLTSPSGKAFKITVDDNGALTATALN